MTEYDELQAEIAELEREIRAKRAVRTRLEQGRLLPEDRVLLEEILDRAIAEQEQAEREGPEAVEALAAELEAARQRRSP